MAAVLSALCMWGTTWAFYPAERGNWTTWVAFFVACLLFLAGLGLLGFVFLTKSKDPIAGWIAMGGAYLTIVLSVVAQRDSSGFLEVQAGIMASLILALANARNPEPAHQGSKRKSKARRE